MKLEGAVCRAAAAAMISAVFVGGVPAGADPAAQNPPAPGAQSQPGPQPVPPAQPMPVPPNGPAPVPGGETKAGPEAAPTTGKHRPEPYFEDISWFNLEILNWIMRPGRVPPLATLGTVASRAVLGVEGTTVALADNVVSTNLVGGRATYGRWFNAGQKTGFEASFFITTTPELDKSEHFSGAPGMPVLGRPFINAIT